MPENIEIVSEWVETFREDVEASRRSSDDEAVSEDARKYAAAALNYLISRMDLIPDWTDTIGVVDDVMVCEPASSWPTSTGCTTTSTTPTRWSPSADWPTRRTSIEAILGHDLEAKFRKFCARMTDTAVRGRTPETIVTDADARKKLYAEIEDDLKRMPAATFTDADGVKAKLVSYLTAKLKDL